MTVDRVKEYIISRIPPHGDVPFFANDLANSFNICWMSHLKVHKAFPKFPIIEIAFVNLPKDKQLLYWNINATTPDKLFLRGHFQPDGKFRITDPT